MSLKNYCHNQNYMIYYNKFNNINRWLRVVVITTNSQRVAGGVIAIIQVIVNGLMRATRKLSKWVVVDG